MKVLVTGGAGFIGVNVAEHHLLSGDEVVIFDNLSRRGTTDNLAWLQERHDTDRLKIVMGDIRDFDSLRATVTHETDRVYHLAAQVAVTTSVTDPREDFEVNALGTFNVLEAVRQMAPQATVIYASTNKVYGSMESIRIAERRGRYEYVDLSEGVSEKYPLDFHSPYGCSKGSGDQYVRDYARIYGLKTVVMRQSCIYGPRQMGVEDQGWIAHFCIAARMGRPITIFGDGKQVRDVLWIDDLIRVYEAAAARIDAVAGSVYNIGGGPTNTLAVWAEFGPLLESLAGKPVDATYAEWRPGDQPVYVSAITKAERELGWRPQVSVDDGLRRLWNWVDDNHMLFEEAQAMTVG
ncbi:MAG: GDP-mannose 4,6-dehydratase [Actinobacteria bacterium]|nr:GDP-mannose 4,6-dehydratase [Actinomycetota bacterium]